MVSRLWAGIVLVLATAIAGHGQTAGSPDERTIRAQLAAYADARQRGDGHAQALFYADDADTRLSTTGTISKGRTEIERELNLPPDPSRRFKLEIDAIRFLSSDVALVDATYYGQSSTPSGYAFYVMVKRGSQWLIRATRTARLAAASR